MSPHRYPSRSPNFPTALDDELTRSDDWYILDSEPNSFVLVVYRGSNDAWDGYGGGTLYTKVSSRGGRRESPSTFDSFLYVLCRARVMYLPRNEEGNSMACNGGEKFVKTLLPWVEALVWCPGLLPRTCGRKWLKVPCFVAAIGGRCVVLLFGV